MTTATPSTSSMSSRPAAPARVGAPARISYAALVRVEWGKATDTRAARWLIAITAVLTVAITLIPIFDTDDIAQTFPDYAGIVTIPLSFLLPIVAVLTLTSEWTQRTVLTTFTQEPRRLRVVSAKIVVSLIMSVVAAVLAGLVSLAGLAVSDAIGHDVSFHAGGAQLGGLLVYVVLNLLLGVAFGAALQNSPAAIVLSLVLPIVVSALAPLTDVLKNWFDTGTTFGRVQQGHFGDHTAGIVVSILVWIIAPLAFGLVRTARREIS